MTSNSGNSTNPERLDTSSRRHDYRHNSQFLRSGKNRPCPVCGRTKDADCSMSADGNWVGCHTYMDGADIAGWHYYQRLNSDFQGGFVREQPNRVVKSVRPKQTRYFHYPNRDNSPLVRAARIDDGNGQKKNWTEHWCDGKWVKGCPQKIRHLIPIYKYAEVRAAIQRGETVFVVEGEPAADALWQIGIPATTTIGGCGGYGNYGRYQTDLVGANLVLAPDRDAKGLAYMVNFGRDFPDRIIGCYFAGLPTLWRQPDGGMDIFDDIQDYGYTKPDIIARIIPYDERHLKHPHLVYNSLLELNPSVDDSIHTWAEADRPNPQPEPNVSVDEIIHTYTHTSQTDPKIAVRNLLERELSSADYHIELAILAKHLGLSISYLTKIAESLQTEQNTIHNRASHRAEIERLLTVRQTGVDIHQILPLPLAKPISLVSTRLGHSCEAYILYLLTGVGGMLHSGSQIQINQDYQQPGNLYGAVVAESGHRKSPVQRQMLTKPLDLLQRAHNQAYEQNYSQYEVELEIWNSLSNEEKRNTPKPKPPHHRRVYLNNITMEGLESAAADQPEQSAIYIKDELKGIFTSANAHRGGKGDDTEKYLSYYDGQILSKERVGSGFTCSNHEIRFATIGTIQPAVLEELAGKGTDDNGLMSRFLYAKLNYNFTPLPIDGGGVDISEMLADVYRRVNDLSPTTYKLTPAALQTFAEVFDSYGRNAIDQSKGSWERNTWAKAGGQLARLCLNLHVLWGSVDGSVDEWIQPSTVERAAQLMAYFISQAVEIIANHSPSLPPQLVKTLTVAKAKNGVTPRELYHAIWGKLKPHNVGQARDWLNELVEMGYGEFIPIGKTSKFIPTVDDIL
jgi:hypothetical protein